MQHGLPKLAKEKKLTFLSSVFGNAALNRRFAVFLVTVGLKAENVYSRIAGDLLIQLLTRAFEGDKEQIKTMAEKLDDGYDNPIYIPTDRAVDMIIGPDAKRGDAGAWEAPFLYAVGTAQEIEDLLDEIEELDSKRVGGRRSVSLDSVIELTMDRYLMWTENAAGKLLDAFRCFDADHNGLELPEFKVFLSDECKRQFSDRDAEKLWSTLLADVGFEVDEGLFPPHEAEKFPIACLNMPTQVLVCQLRLSYLPMTTMRASTYIQVKGVKEEVGPLLPFILKPRPQSAGKERAATASPTNDAPAEVHP